MEFQVKRVSRLIRPPNEIKMGDVRGLPRLHSRGYQNILCDALIIEDLRA